MADEPLLPCPFCGAGKTRIDKSTYWTGMSSQILSVTVIHWCDRGGIDGGCVKINGRTEEQAISRWNTRHTHR